MSMEELGIGFEVSENPIIAGKKPTEYLLENMNDIAQLLYIAHNRAFVPMYPWVDLNG